MRFKGGDDLTGGREENECDVHRYAISCFSERVTGGEGVERLEAQVNFAAHQKETRKKRGQVNEEMSRLE
jgi:hypothetical protein